VITNADKTTELLEWCIWVLEHNIKPQDIGGQIWG